MGNLFGVNADKVITTDSGKTGEAGIDGVNVGRILRAGRVNKLHGKGPKNATIKKEFQLCTETPFKS